MPHLQIWQQSLTDLANKLFSGESCTLLYLSQLPKPRIFRETYSAVTYLSVFQLLWSITDNHFPLSYLFTFFAVFLSICWVTFGHKGVQRSCTQDSQMQPRVLQLLPAVLAPSLAFLTVTDTGERWSLGSSGLPWNKGRLKFHCMISKHRPQSCNQKMRFSTLVLKSFPENGSFQSVLNSQNIFGNPLF